MAKKSKLAEWKHSIPTWTMSKRGANPKFQAGVELAGVGPVKERLLAIQKLSDELSTSTISGKPLLTSLHILHEVRSKYVDVTKLNNPNAISRGDLKKGIKSGRFPQVLAITAPAFGFAGIERGAILSPNSLTKSMAKNLHIEAIEFAEELEGEKLGKGIVIWWPAFDARRLDLLENQEPMAFEEAWQKLRDFWVEILQQTKGQVWLEWKTGDPGIDYLCTLKLAIDFCNDVNKELGRKAMFINNEWAHLLIGGTTVAEGTRRTIDAGLFTGFVHVNSAQLLPVSIEYLMESGCSPEAIAFGMDWDWAVGMGGEARWNDQEEAVDSMDTCGAETIYAEHDINPAGQDPIEFAKRSIENLETMLAAVREARS